MSIGMIIMIVVFSLVGLSLLISLYVFLSVKLRLKKIVTYDDAVHFELKEIEKNHITWNLNRYNFHNIYKTIATKFGPLDLYKFGTSEKVVIFVHGIWSNNRNVIKILDYFISRNYSVIAYDNFGWGKSRNFGTTSLGKKESLLLFDVTNYINQKLSPKELIIYGESMGGATVYSLLGLFNNHMADKYIINAGYMSFFQNIIKLGKHQIWYLIYLAYLPLLLIFWIEKWPIKPFINKKDLKSMENVYHLHSKNDKLVAYKSMEHYLPYINHYHIYENPNVPHVLGWYYATNEHYATLDQWLNIKTNKNK